MSCNLNNVAINVYDWMCFCVCWNVEAVIVIVCLCKGYICEGGFRLQFWLQDFHLQNMVVGGDSSSEAGTKLYISNLDFNVSNEDIKVKEIYSYFSCIVVRFCWWIGILILYSINIVAFACCLRIFLGFVLMLLWKMIVSDWGIQMLALDI